MFTKWSLIGVFAIFSGLGVGVHHLYQKRKLEEALNSKNLKVPPGKRKLEFGKDKNRDDDKWKRKLNLYIEDSILDGFEKLEEGENLEERNVEAMKSACDALLSKRYVEDEIEEKQMQAERWCFTTKETVGDMLFMEIEDDQILIFEGQDVKDKSEFERRINLYKEEYADEIVEFEKEGKIEKFKLSDLDDKLGIEESNNKVKELIRDDCLDLWDLEWNEENEASFRKWCMRDIAKNQGK